VRLARRAGVLIALASVLALAVAPGASAAGRCGAHAWCDATLPADQRAELLVRALTLPEKQELLWGDEQFDVPGGRERHTGTNHGIPRLDVPPLYLSDGPVGPRQGAGATAMPAPLGLAAAFDPALAARAGALVAAEAKAKGNDLVYAPTVNLMRTPRGGRTFEGYGEDPFLAGRTAVGWINGAQATGVIASVKHFAVNNQETERMSINAEIDERTLRELYLPQFEAAVKEGPRRLGDVRLPQGQRPVRVRERAPAERDPQRRVGLSGHRPRGLPGRARHGRLAAQRP